MKEVPLVLLFTPYSFVYRRLKIFKNKNDLLLSIWKMKKTFALDQITRTLPKGGPNHVVCFGRLIYYWLFGFKFDRSNEGAFYMIVKMGKHKYKKTIREDGYIHFSRLPKNPPEIPRADLPDDIVRISYHCCGCEEDFEQNIPRLNGDVTQLDVAQHFMKCGKGVDYKYIRRRDLS